MQSYLWLVIELDCCVSSALFQLDETDVHHLIAGNFDRPKCQFSTSFVEANGAGEKHYVGLFEDESVIRKKVKTGLRYQD